MGAAAFYSHAWLAAAFPGSGEAVRILRIVAAIGLALVTLAASARLLRIREFDAAAARVLKRLRR
jgi:hypothetical protein